MQLSWQPGFSPSRTPAKRAARRRNRHQQFEFVVEYPQSVRCARRSPSFATRTQTPSLPDTSSGQSLKVDAERSCCQSEEVNAIRLSINPAPGTLNDEQWILSEGHTDIEAIKRTAKPRSNWYNIEDHDPLSFPLESANGTFDITSTTPDTVVGLALTGNPATSTSEPRSITYRSLTHRFKKILYRYNREFCTIPLTFDLRLNPFRYCSDKSPEPMFLVHAVMALAGHHVNSTSTLSHRGASLQSLREGLNAFNVTKNIYPMLDTIVILFSLDETQSMLGNWSTHLMGAYDLIESCGGIISFIMTSRVEVQLGILTWWDAIISLLAREDCVFPYAYFDAVLSNQHKQDWGFTELCGCPTNLVKIVMQVARLSSERQQSSLTAGFAFNDTVISEIEQALESWLHIPAATTFQDEESMHLDQDVMHCSEAWRHGLLLYIYRIFRWKTGSCVPTNIIHRARVIVDHVFACREVNMMSRQALLPLFFAGCELQDRSTQVSIVKLCSLWDDRTRYHVFGGAIPLLEAVWAQQETKGFENIWWGLIVDEQHMSDIHPLKMRLCFG